MPACRDCVHFDGSVCVIANLKEDMPLRTIVKEASRACMYAIFQKHLPNMNGDIIEIGFGVSRVVRNVLRRRGNCVWKGVDSRYRASDARGCIEGSAAHIPLQDNSIDWVLAFETIEHWEEYKETPEQGIAEALRVLKPGGSFLLTAPIHQHGTDPFILGDTARIKGWFSSGWGSVYFEEWRREYEPLPKLEEWKVHHRQRMLDGLKVQEVPSMWKLEILARK